MMKPALETISLGKGGVIQPKQHHSFLCSFLVQLQPWLLSPGPLQANPNHPISRNTVFLCSHKIGRISPVPHYTLSQMFRPLHLSPGSIPATHTSPAPPSRLPARVFPRSTTLLSFTLPPAQGQDHRAAAAFRVRSCLDCSSPPVPRKPGSFSPQVPMKAF